MLDPEDLATALPYLQPLALSASTRNQVSKGLLTELATAIAEVTGEEAPRSSGWSACGPARS